MTPRLRFVLRPSDVDPAEAALPDDLLLRAAVVLVGLAAIRSLVVVDLLEPRTALLCGLATIGCSALARWTLSRPGLRWLRLAAWLAVGAVSVVHALVDPLARDPRLLLGMLVAGFVAATAAEQDGSRRSMLVNLALGLAVIALAAGVAPEASLVVPMGLGWVGALVALLRTAPRRERLGTAAPLSGAEVSRGTGGAVLALRTLLGPLVACVVVGLLAFALLQTVHPQDPYGGSGSGPFSAGSAGQAGPQAGRLATAFTGDTMDLRQRGELSEIELLEVPSSSPELWRTGMLDTYTGSTWQSSRSGAATLLGRGTVRVPEDPTDPRPSGTAPSAPTGPAPGQGWSVAVLDPRMTTVAVPGIATSVSVAVDPTRQTSPFGSIGVVRLLDGRLITVEGPAGAGRPPQVASVDAYTVGALTRAGVAGLAPASTAAVPPGADSGDPRETRWTQLPERVPARVRDLAAALTAVSPTRLDLVKAIETDLRTRARYTLDSPVPAEDADAVDDFLFVTREGFCEQFASAEVVLLRAAGVPARMVVGFAGGEEEVGARILRGKDAHAWVEVWFPGQGWVTSDPTAGATPVTTSSLDTVLDALARWWPLLVALLVAAGTLAAWVIARGRRVDSSGPGLARPAEVVALLAAFDRYERALAATGAARRPDESLAGLAARTDDAPARAALATLERLTFAPRTPDPADCLAAAQALTAASDALSEPARAR